MNKASAGIATVLLVISLSFLLGFPQLIYSGETSHSKGLPPQVLSSLLSATNVIWDEELKTTNVLAGADFGRFVFCFTNLSLAPLTIISVKTSCGCTTAQLPAMPWLVPAGSNGQIGVSVNLAGKAGTLVKTFTIETDQGTKTLMVEIVIEPPATPAMSKSVRIKNMQLAQANRQAVFNGDCAGCHVKSIEGQYAKQLYDSVCGICHEGANRATMVPDLHKLTVPTDELFWRTWISYGRPGSLMPAFAKTEKGPLTDAQIVSLSAYLEMTFPSRITNLIR